MVMGTPCRRPSSLPLARCLSAACAAFSASSLRSTTTAFSRGLTARIRSRCTSTVSTAEIAPLRIAAAVSTADHCQTGPFGRRAVAALRGAGFLTVFLTAFATAILRAVLVLTEVFVTFLATLFFFVAVFFATPHLQKIARRRLWRSRERVQARFCMARRRDALPRAGARDAHEPLAPLS